jgi:hypothetical protein
VQQSGNIVPVDWKKRNCEQKACPTTLSAAFLGVWREDGKGWNIPGWTTPFQKIFESGLNFQAVVQFDFQFLAIAVVADRPVGPKTRIGIRVLDSSEFQIVKIVAFMEKDGAPIGTAAF